MEEVSDSSEHHNKRLEEAVLFHQFETVRRRTRPVNVVTKMDSLYPVDTSTLINCFIAQPNREKRHTCNMRLQNPTITGLQFQSGTTVTVGSRRAQVSRFAGHQTNNVISLIRDGMTCQVNFDINNIVLTTRTHPQNLKKIAHAFSEASRKQDGSFPWFDQVLLDEDAFRGLTCGITDGVRSISFTIYSSGSVIICGCESEEDGMKYLERVFPMFEQFRIVDNNNTSRVISSRKKRKNVKKSSLCTTKKNIVSKSKKKTKRVLPTKNIRVLPTNTLIQKTPKRKHI
jgi:TATA-box binding protein (TBP) (component of TFIID and TFIIIB)